MKKIIIIILLIICIFSFKNVFAYDKYGVEDYAFFDPVTDNPCNETNYWTIYDQDTTCYRFIVLNNNDTKDNKTIKVLLDHDIANSTFDEYESVLANKTSNWKRYKSIIDIADEDTISNIMKLTTLPTHDGNITVNGGEAINTMYLNTMFVQNGTTTNNYGYWLKGEYPGSNTYAYTITEYGNNRLVEKSQTRGIRPMLDIDKSLLIKSKIIDKTNDFTAAKEYKYKNIPSVDGSYDGYNYNQLQGFTITNSKLVFYSSNSGNPTKGLLVSYGGDNYTTLNKIDYVENGHGNGVTFNSKDNKVLVLGSIDGNIDIYEYDADTLNYIKNHNNTAGYSSIGYDYKNNYYFMRLGNRIIMTDTSFNQLYAFDIPTLLGKQDIEYKNGYLYYTTFDYGVLSNGPHLYSLGPKYSSRVYVYNAKLKSDKTPDNNFGRLDRVYFIDNIQRTTKNDGEKGTGELEDISFHENKVVLGYASQAYDSINTFKFYELDYSKIKSNLNLDIIYNKSDDKTTIEILSKTQLKELDGWTLSANKYSLLRTYENVNIPKDITICDYYDNCTNINISNEENVIVPNTNKNNKYRIIEIIGAIVLIGVGSIYIIRKKLIFLK